MDNINDRYQTTKPPGDESFTLGDEDTLIHESIQSIPQDDKEQKFGRVKMKRSTWHEIIIATLVVMVIASGAFNRVANKVMTVPMGDYSFFLSLFNAVMYCLLYFSILFVRFKLGIVKTSALAYPWKRPRKANYARIGGEEKVSGLRRVWDKIPPLKYFIVMGFCDALGNVLGLIAAPEISGPMISLMSQAIILFTIIAAVTILRTKYTYWQIWSVLIVLGGATIALSPELAGGNGKQPLKFLIIMLVSTAPNAVSFTLKELVFQDRPDLDIFIVNSHSSLFQFVWWPIFIPVAVLLNSQIDTDFGSYIKNGFLCFAGFGYNETMRYQCNCRELHVPSAVPYFIYIAINLFFNIVLLLLLKRASALMGFMAIKAILPISVLLFYFKWPLLGSTKISNFVIAGLAVILVGLGLFRATTVIKKRNPDKSYCCSPWLPWGEKKVKPGKLSVQPP